jgi:hypothetical protein
MHPEIFTNQFTVLIAAIGESGDDQASPFSVGQILEQASNQQREE